MRRIIKQVSKPLLLIVSVMLAGLAFFSLRQGGGQFNPEDEASWQHLDQGQQDPGKLHELQHWMGREFYKREGLRGVAFCSDQYNFGCYHGFFGQALSQEGLEFLSLSEKACLESAGRQAGGCLHGIGHGVLAHQGYDEAGLRSSLDGCDRLEDIGSRDGCYSGVFMEFNLGTMHQQSKDGLYLRSFNRDKPFFPCDAVADRYRMRCFFEQPAWWIKLDDRDIKATAEKCAKIEKTEYRMSCYQGLGQVVLGEVGFESRALAESCSKIEESEGRLECSVTGGWQLMLAGKDERESCSLLKGQWQEDCRQRLKELRCQTLKEGCKR